MTQDKKDFIEAMLTWFRSPQVGNDEEIDREFLSDAYDSITCPRWISVEDELPKERQSCIILIDQKALQGTPRIRSAVYAPNVMMQQEGFAYNRMSKKHHITHWMPLPQAPKKGGKE